MNIKPGDLFEWVYTGDNSPTIKDEELYSHILVKWIPCNGLCLCVGLNDKVIHWISNNWVFSAFVAPSPPGIRRGLGPVIPRKVES